MSIEDSDGGVLVPRRWRARCRRPFAFWWLESTGKGRRQFDGGDGVRRRFRRRLFLFLIWVWSRGDSEHKDVLGLCFGGRNHEMRGGGG